MASRRPAATVVYEACPGAARRPVAGYARRAPEATPLYRIVQTHLPTMLAEARAETAHGFGLPRFIEREFDGYLGCGILGRGFARVRCASCADEVLVAFSCKGRGVCPSCTARRMADTAAHLVDHVLPVARYRQWVWTMPRAVRLWLARDGARISRVHTLFLRAVFAWQRQLAKRRGIAGRVHPGAVTFIQRFGGQLNLNVHFHAVVPDGVFAEDSPGGRVSFHPLPGPRDEDVLAIAHRVVRRILAALERAADRDADTPPDDESAALDAVQAAAVETRSLLPATPSTAPLSFHRRSVAFDGFSLHAAVQIPAADRAGLERLCRYGARPAFASERLTLTAAGQVSYRLKRPWPDRRTHLFLPPVAFRRRLAGILPPPRRHLLRYAGVFAPRAALRSRVVALAPAAATTTASTAVLPPPHRQPTRLPWADLLQRVFAVDVLACPCGGRRRVLAFITDLDVARSILTALGLPATIPTFAPARGPPQQSFDDWLDPPAEAQADPAPDPDGSFDRAFDPDPDPAWDQSDPA